MRTVTRRRMLQYLAMTAAQPLASRATRVSGPPSSAKPNIVILVFDTLSAAHMSLYGYARRTTPNMERFADCCTVYHRHYSAGNFTNPGTASLLTGTYPWTHRCIHLYGTIAEEHVHHNLFAALGPEYHRVAYSHNAVVEALLYQMRDDIDLLVPTEALCLLDQHVSDSLFANDYEMAVWREHVFGGVANLTTRPTSLWLRSLALGRYQRRRAEAGASISAQFPRGLPRLYEQVFTLEDAVDWLGDLVSAAPRPFVIYWHVLPPHEPYNPRREYIGSLGDVELPTPPQSTFSEGWSEEFLYARRTEYDEHIAYADAEFGRLAAMLEDSGALDDTCVVVTSDHGEMFERGLYQHATPAMYDPEIRVPLLMHAPGQTQRRDVHLTTSAVDLVPALLALANGRIPPWAEGEAARLLSDGGTGDADAVYALQANRSPKQGPIATGTLMLAQGQHKLVSYFGYPEVDDTDEFYDLAEDPAEQSNLVGGSSSVLADLRGQLVEVKEVLTAVR